MMKCTIDGAYVLDLIVIVNEDTFIECVKDNHPEYEYLVCEFAPEDPRELTNSLNNVCEDIVKVFIEPEKCEAVSEIGNISSMIGYMSQSRGIVLGFEICRNKVKVSLMIIDAPGRELFNIDRIVGTITEGLTSLYGKCLTVSSDISVYGLVF